MREFLDYTAMLDELQDAIDEVLQTNISASQIGYDNTASGLSATNVQEAIDEIQGEFSNISIKNSFLITSHSYSISGINNISGTKTLTQAGYYPLGIVGWHNNQWTWFTVDRLELTSVSSGSATFSYLIACGDNTVSRSGTLSIRVLWVKE